MFGSMAFHQIFPDVGLEETRTVMVLEDANDELPPDNYGFVEFYCVGRT